MTRERKQDCVLAALAVSVVLHAALMALVRPQVLARIAAAAPRTPRTIVVRDAPPSAPSDVFALPPDVAPEKGAPAADADGLPVPAAPSRVFEAEAAAVLSGVSFDLPDADLPETVPERTFSPRVFETREIAVPLVMPAARISPAPGAPPPAPEGVSVVFCDVPAPAPSAPPDAELAAFVPAPEETPAREPSFRPIADVMRDVDERVVAAEKDAVRDLLNVRGARDLAPCVEMDVASASSAGWTYVRVTFRATRALATMPKDVVVLLDASGSIGNDRLSSCRAAARKILRSCTNTDDRFNLVAFRDRYAYAFPAWRACDRSAFEAADRWLSGLAAHGRTDVFATIRSVLTLPRDPARPLVAMVVTDGDATAGVRETEEILSRFTRLNDGLVSVYLYGVKATANRELLELLACGNRGESFVFDGRRWHAGDGLETLAARFRAPVLSDVRLVFPSDRPVEAYPRLLRNLYEGGEVSFCGRVPSGVPSVSFSLRGLGRDGAYEGFFTVDPAAARFDAGLPAAWAAASGLDGRLR